MSAFNNRCDTYSLAGGRQLLVSCPQDLTPDEADEFSTWLQLLAKKAARLSVLPTALVATPSAGGYSAVLPSSKEPELEPIRLCSKCPAFLNDAESLQLGTCFGCRSPGPTQSIDGPPAHEVGGTLPPPKPKAPADVAEVATEGKAQPAATDRQPAEGERKSNAAKGRDNRQKLADVLKAANGPLTCSDLAKATGLTYPAAHAMLNGHDCFQKSPSGKWELSPKAAQAS